MYVRLNGEKCPIYECNYEVKWDNGCINETNNPRRYIAPNHGQTFAYLTVLVPSNTMIDLDNYDLDMQDDVEQELELIKEFIEYNRMGKAYKEFKDQKYKVVNL